MSREALNLGDALADEEPAVQMQPLARIDKASERAWAQDWLAGILGREGATIDPVARDHLWSALTSLASAPNEERTLTGLSVLLQSTELKRALKPFCLGGPFGRLLDAEAEDLGSAEVLAFETEGLIGSAAAPAVLAYLFHRIEARLDGRPTMILIDEGLGLSRRQVHRLLKRFQDQGPAAIRHKARGRASNNRIDPAVREYAVTLVRESYIDLPMPRGRRFC